MKTHHKVLLFFKKIEWFIIGVYNSVAFSKEVKNYNFLIKAQNTLEMKLLEIKRNEKESEVTIRIEAQIDVIKKILKYVSR